MILKELLSHLSGVRRGGDGYVARCPAHDDKHQSLSLTEDVGRILIHCHAGCPTTKILAEIGYAFRDLYDKRIEKPSRSSLGEAVVKPFRNAREGFAYFPSSNTKKVHKVYRYLDANGNLLYENVRYYPKDFRQRHYDVKNKPVWTLEGVERVPYRLPQLINAAKDGRDVFLCEGEKDADSLAELGFTATSFKNWKPEFNQYIQGLHVVIVQDHDLPGQTQAKEAASMMLRSAASIRILDVWKDIAIADKGGPDISDYIRVCVQDEGLGGDEIKERIAMTVERSERWKQDVNPYSDNYFLVRSGNEWIESARNRPSPKKLFGEFWFEGELCILFADTNVGKSILAVQIADAISKGEPIQNIKVQCAAQKVVYFDFELTAKQFESRFSERLSDTDRYVNHYKFHHNFYRAEINPETSDLKGFTKFEDFLNHSLDSTIVSTGAKVLIIDNLTYLRDETENARNALPLMKYLKGLKTRHGLSILALAHTPKRDSAKPLSRNDLQGSKMLINFCDSSFAIGESTRDIGVRYLKQIKARNTEIIYASDHVYLARVEKKSNFLQFTFGGFGNEFEHLKVQTDEDRLAQVDRCREMAAKGMKNVEIAQVLGVSKVTIGRWLKQTTE